MLVCEQLDLLTELYCDRPCADINNEDFLFYDKDGFELNKAEQKYYALMEHDLSDCLNHPTFTKTWYTTTSDNLIVDHSLILYRCEYRGDAKHQLLTLKKTLPQASLLINTRAKWGFDLALDSVDPNGDIYEVIHIEYDTSIFSQFCSELNKTQEHVNRIDWHNAARTIWLHKSQWQNLRGFAQNDWKAKFILNWSRAEFTEKAM